jgi:hypothetical protein
MAALTTGARPAGASFTQCATNWNNFNNPGFLVEYTYQGQIIADEETAADSSHGQATPPPAFTDLASGSPGAYPGPEATSYFGYYDGGTVWDPNDPATMEDDYIVFRVRVEGSPRSGAAFDSAHWNVLFDVDGDGYKEYWVDLDGSYGSGAAIDRLQILYDNSNRQDIPNPDAARVEVFTARHSPDGAPACTGGSPGVSHTRTIQINDGTPDWWIEMQVPMTAFNDLAGNQVLFPDSPVAFVFSTGTSNQDPLQKDFMQDLNFLTLADPITFGDIVTPSGRPRLEFTDQNLEPVSFYAAGENVYIYLTDPASNTDSSTVQCINVVVTNPSTGDDEAVTLCESGPATGIFTNRGGACEATITNPSPAPQPPTAWLVGLRTSNTTVTENWSLTYNSGTNQWTVVGSVSGTQPAFASHGVAYSSATGGISFTLYQNNPANGTVLSFCTRGADPLPTSSAGGTDNDGTLQVFSGDDIYVSFTNPSFITVTDQAVILGACEALILFTRATGLPSTDFQLTADPATSDRLYVTVFHREANTNPLTVQTITVTLTGNDTETLTLTETGPNTGEFRNATGLPTRIEDGVVTPNDGLWEDVDTGVVTATYSYNCGGSAYSPSTQASLFTTAGGGRVDFVNGAGTQEVDLYGANLPVWLKVTDSVACPVFVNGVRTLQVTVTSPAGDSEAVTVYETFSGSSVYMNRRGDLVTTAGSAVVTSASSSFITAGVQPGDAFAIATGPDLGLYTVASVNSQTQLTLTTNLTASRTGIGFSAQPLLTATDDGAVAANDGVIESDHEDLLTASYTDCFDGDLDVANDVKTDTAVYNAPSLLINEVLFYPDTAATSCQTEAVELYNASAVPITATGYTITDEDGFSYAIPSLGGSNIVLQPGEFIYLSLWNANPPNDFFLNGTYYLFTQAGATYPSDRFADPASADPADQVTLFDSFGVAQDYVGWSSTLSPSLDFFSDDASAVLRSIWQDDSFRNATAIALAQSMARATNGFDTNRPSDWGFVSNNTCQIIATRAFVSSFRAFREGGKVVTEWETSSQSGTLGFYLYRLDERGERYVQVTKDLVPALLDAPQGGLYRVSDPGARGETLSYVLMEVESGPSGAAHRFHGPYTARVETSGPSRAPRRRGASEEAYPFTVSRQERSRLGVRRTPSPVRSFGSSGGPRAKISLETEGLYALSVADIASVLGISENETRTRLQTGRFRLTNEGRPVGWTTSADGGKLLFWGEAIDSVYTRENVYWLEPGRGIEMPQARRDRSRQGGAIGTSFRYIAHFEEDAFPATLVSTDPESDYWQWTYVSSGNPTYGRARLTLELSGIAPSSSESNLAVHLFSATDTSGGEREDHHVKVRLNGAAAGEGRWGGIGAYTLEAAVPTSLLREGENVVEIEGVLDTGAPFSIFYVDSVDVTHPRLYHAPGPTFVFRADGARSLRVSGFSEPGIMVLDIQNPRRPSRVDAVVEPAGDGFSVRFDSSPDGVYAAIAPGGRRAPLSLWADQPSNLRSKSNAFDYIVVAPAGLEAAAERLAKLRESSGLHSRVVLLEDVMDEFHYGISTPHAIREFLGHAYRSWARPPRFAVLAGAGDLDYKGLYGLGGNLLPSIMASTPNGLYAADNRFGDVDEDGWPEISVGRIPAVSAAELDAYIDKLEGFEASGMSLWSDSVLMVADDDPWARSTFDRHSESMAASVPASSSLQRIYLGSTSAAAARVEILARVSEGTVLVNYVGHGGLDRIADESLLQTSDVPRLGNGVRAGFLTALSCSINRFELAGFTSLGEALVVEPKGGATAVWAPSGLSLDFEAFRLGSAFFRAVFEAAEPTLGEAVLAAFGAYREGGGVPLTPTIYNLLGDPALRLK